MAEKSTGDVAASGRSARPGWSPTSKLIAVAAGAGVAIQPLLTPPARFQSIILTMPFLLAVLLASTLRLRASALGEARQFWTDLTVGFGSWLCGALSFWVLRGDLGIASQLAVDSIFSVSLVAFVRASERTPHRPQPRRAGASWPLATIFVFGLFLYFVLFVAIDQPERYLTNRPSRLLGAAVNIYLALRFGSMALAAGRGWRATHAALAASWFLGLTYGVLRLARDYDLLASTVWFAVFIALAVAARSQPPVAAGQSGGASANCLHAATGNHAMIAVLVLPALHFAGYSLFNILETDLRAPREILVGAWLLGFGAIALVERRRFYRLLSAQIAQREALRQKASADDDLRVILERQHMDASLDQSVAKYTRAFELCPESIGISTLAEGRFLEVNPAFERMTGHHRDDIVGKTSTEVGLWIDTGDRNVLVNAVRRRGEARGVELPIRTRGGNRLRARFWAESIEIGGERCVIIVARPIDSADSSQLPDTLPPPLEASPSPAFLLNEAGRVQGQNQAATTILGLDGQAADSLDFDRLPWNRSNPRDAPPQWSSLCHQLRHERMCSLPGLRALALDAACTQILVVAPALGAPDPARGNQDPRSEIK